MDDFEGEDCREGDADEPHADKTDPERADGVAGALHSRDENHAVAEKDFRAGDVAEVVGGLVGDSSFVGEKGVG